MSCCQPQGLCPNCFVSGLKERKKQECSLNWEQVAISVCQDGCAGTSATARGRPSVPTLDSAKLSC